MNGSGEWVARASKAQLVKLIAELYGGNNWHGPGLKDLVAYVDALHDDKEYALAAPEIWMTKDLITLGEIAARTAMLEVACSRCERRGRYRLDTLIARYGAEGGARNMVPELTADCPKRASALQMERCDVFFPGLAKLFYVRR